MTWNATGTPTDLLKESPGVERWSHGDPLARGRDRAMEDKNCDVVAASGDVQSGMSIAGSLFI